MKNILSKIFSSKNDLNSKEKYFLEITNRTKVSKLFKVFSNFSDLSEIRYVGGCVRKILNDEKFDDIDLATNLKPNEVKECLKSNNIDFFETGIEHGTITARLDEKNFEITSLRKDILTDGRHAKVEFTNEWTEDALRRDFTFNSIYADKEGNLFDPNDGVKDLETGKIEFIGDPEQRVKEDYLRVLRYIRFFLNYSKVEHSENLKKIIKQNLNGLSKISSDRQLDELKKLILSKGLFKLSKDKFCNEVISLLFPQLVNLNILENINETSQKIIEKKNFIFLISLMIIDDTDNSDYFIYKYNISNEDKKKIRFLSNIYSKNLDKNIFKEKNLWKILYYNGKDYLIDLIDFKLFQNKKLDKNLLNLKEFFSNQESPKFQIKAKTLIEKFNYKEGKELGIKLKEIEDFWIENSFKITDQELKKIIKN